MRGETEPGLSLHTEEIDQIGRLAFVRLRHLLALGSSTHKLGHTVREELGAHNCLDVSTDITRACKFICSSALFVVKIRQILLQRTKIFSLN